MVTRFVVNYYILPIDVNAVARQNVVITTFCNVTTFWVATYPEQTTNYRRVFNTVTKFKLKMNLMIFKINHISALPESSLVFS